MNIEYEGRNASLAYIRDVTERKQIETALRESSQRYINLVQSVTDIIIVMDAQGNATYESPSTAKILGYPPDHFVGKSPFPYIHEEDLGRVLRDFDEVVRRENPGLPTEFRIRKADGTWVTLEALGNNLTDSPGLNGMVITARDVTERRLMENRLRESEARFRAVTETALDSIFIKDADLKYVLVNPAMERFFGKAAHAMIGRTGDDIFGPEGGKRVQEMDRRVLKGIIVNEELPLPAVGGMRIFHVVKVPLADAQGKVIGLCGIARDITERKRTEEALKESEAKFRDLSEQAMVGIYLIQDDLFRYVNSEFAGILGYEIDEMTDKITAKDIIFPEDLPLVEENLRRRISGEVRSLRYDFRIVTRKGVVKHAEVYSSRTLYRGRPAVIGTLLDITERKSTEEELKRLSVAIEQAAEDVVITDPEGVIQYVNPAFERITGYPRSEAIGRTPRLLKSGVHDASFYENLWKTVKSGSIWRGRITNRRKDGKLIQEDATISPLMNSAGQLTGFVSLKRDVTEEVKLESRLRQAQKMEAIGNLAGGIAHDFNNILGAIIGYTELYKDQVHDRLKVYNSMEQVLKAALRARDLVQQILTFSRKTEPRKSPTTVIPIVKEITKFLRASLPANIEIRHSLNATSDLILADPSQIHQVLMNLCTNAGHAMAQTGGILEIGLDEVFVLENDYFEFSTLESGRYLHLSVLDTGHGIMPEHLDKIFDPYFTTKSIGEGTGLGLAVVHGIVKDHGGEIRVYSNVGKGTVFHVYLRLIEQQPAKEGPRQPAPLPRGKETILFVDDERMLADLGKLLLEELGYTVLAETDALAAVGEFKRRKDVIDLVITDKTMPQMTGLDVAREIRAIRPDVPVILCSGFQTVEDIQAQSDLGILHFINKPIMKHVMAHKVREVLNQRKRTGETPA